MHVTDSLTDGRQDYANSRSYCVAVRSAKKLEFTVTVSAYVCLTVCVCVVRVTV